MKKGERWLLGASVVDVLGERLGYEVGVVCRDGGGLGDDVVETRGTGSGPAAVEAATCRAATVGVKNTT